MQFKVSKKELQVKLNYPDFIFRDYFILEGELLEGGMVEKCKGCKFCLMSEYKTGEECRKNRACWCHNKKEEKNPHGDGSKCDCFNRETKEEEKLPERLIDMPSPLGLTEILMWDKINQILKFLASKENK